MASKIVSIPITCSSYFHDFSKLKEEAFLDKLKQIPINCLDFLGQAIQDSSWVEKHSDFGKMVFRELTNLTLDGKLSIDKVEEALKNFSFFDPVALKSVVSNNLLVWCGDQGQCFSHLIFLLNSNRLKEKWLSSREHSLDVKIEIFAPYLISLNELSIYQSILITCDPEPLSQMTFRKLLRFIKQAVFFGHTQIQTVAENFLGDLITNLASAFEVYPEAVEMNLTQVKVACEVQVHTYRGLRYESGAIIADIRRRDYSSSNRVLYSAEQLEKELHTEDLQELTKVIRGYKEEAIESDCLLIVRRPIQCSPPIIMKEVLEEGMYNFSVYNLSLDYYPIDKMPKAILQDEPFTLTDTEHLIIAKPSDNLVFKKIILGLLHFTPKLKSLVIDSLAVADDDFFEKMALINLRLTAIYLKNLYLSTETINRLPFMYPSLEILHLEKQYISPGFIESLLQFKSFRALMLVSCEGIEPLKNIKGEAFTNLKIFGIHKNETLENEDFVHFFKYAKNLKIGSFTGIKNFDLLSISNECPIQYLMMDAACLKSSRHIEYLQSLPQLKTAHICTNDMSPESRTYLNELLRSSAKKFQVQLLCKNPF